MNCPLKPNRHLQGHQPRFAIHRPVEPYPILCLIDYHDGNKVGILQQLPYVNIEEDLQYWKDQLSTLRLQYGPQVEIAWVYVSSVRKIEE